MGIGFIPLFEGAYQGEYKNLLFADGVHPNDAGHELLMERVWGYIKNEGWIE
jgi:lysophospholipase L1-like esterase